MRQEGSIVNKVDWVVITIYFILVFMGWMNIYAAVYDEELNRSIFDVSLNSGKQLLWIGTSVLIIIVIMTIDFRFYDSFAYIIYGLVVFLLVFVLFFGRTVAGSQSWFTIGGFRMQPSEFAKFATALAVAKYMSSTGYQNNQPEALGDHRGSNFISSSAHHSSGRHRHCPGVWGIYHCIISRGFESRHHCHWIGGSRHFYFNIIGQSAISDYRNCGAGIVDYYV